MSSMININNRLILSGGVHDGIVQNAMWVYDEIYGWHYFNQKLNIALYAHTSALWTKKKRSREEGEKVKQVFSD